MTAMANDNPLILAINCGSSSIKFAVYQEPGQLVAKGKVDHIASDRSAIILQVPKALSEPVKAGDIDEASAAIVAFLDKTDLLNAIIAVGHRIVHGLSRTEPVLISDTVFSEIKENKILAPIHMTAALAMLNSLRKALPQALHVACFDTAFHNGLPELARTIPLPAALTRKGIVRYGFHGLSCTYLLGALQEKAGEKIASGRLIIAHLGNGASMTAVKNMKSIDTTMGFTPEGGLMMGTRPGDLDPGILTYLMRSEEMKLPEVEKLIQSESGLFGVSGTSPDMGELLKFYKTDPRARLAVDLFCYQAQKALCSLCGPLGGLDALVFSGGIGENFPEIRAKICHGLGFLGISIDEKTNLENAFEISGTVGTVRVYVIRTDEEAVIAEQTKAVVDNAN
jgi:acetate kinase